MAFLKRADRVLLGLKTRGLGEGLWNGFGGKVEPNESITHAAKREIEEECNLEVDDLRHIGFMRYERDGKDETAIVHIFTGTQLRGNPEPSEEMNPVQWYHYEDLPLEVMYPDFKDWWHHVLQDRFFWGWVRYNRDTEIVDKCIRECGSLDDVLNCLD